MALARSAIAPRKRNAPRPAWKVADAFRQWLRGRPCCHCASREQIVAAHVDHAGGKGVGTKVADRHCIPLCDPCHRRQHNEGWATFEKRLPGRDAVKLADQYFTAWPGRIAWLRELAQ